MSKTGTSQAGAATGSAERWGPLWGARPADWALSEDQQIPTYEVALERAAFKRGLRVLDIGCGVGAFLRLVADRGAQAFGLDASPALVEFARRRVPEADLRVGDMEALPYDEDSFDLVTGFNSFFFANDIVAALREARRVARPGAPVVIQVWGAHDRNDLEAMKEIVRPFLPPRPDDAPPEPDYSRPGVLDEIATSAGLKLEQAFDTAWAYRFPDAETLRRALVAPAGVAVLVGPEHEDEVKDAIVERLAPRRTPDGGYRLHSEFHCVIARAPDDSREPAFERESVDRELLVDEGARLVRPEVLEARRALARWSRGISSLTTSLTSRLSSASRNFAIRSSSRRIDLASCAVSRSPTSVASVSIRV